MTETRRVYDLKKVNTNEVDSDSKYFFTKSDGDVGGAGGSNDTDYNIAWIYKNAFDNKLQEIQNTYP